MDVPQQWSISANENMIATLPPVWVCVCEYIYLYIMSANAYFVVPLAK